MWWQRELAQARLFEYMAHITSVSSAVLFEKQADFFFTLYRLMFPKIYGLLLEEEKCPAIRTSHKRRRKECGEYRFACICVYLLEKAMATHSSTLAWKILWMEEPGRLQSMGSLGVRHD